MSIERRSLESVSICHDLLPTVSSSVGEWDREVIISIRREVRIRYGRSAPPKPTRYAVTLELVRDGEWIAVRLWDNAHAPDEHHEHEYTRAEGKMQPTRREFDSTNQAMAAAIGEAKAEWREIVNSWKNGQ